MYFQCCIGNNCAGGSGKNNDDDRLSIVSGSSSCTQPGDLPWPSRPGATATPSSSPHGYNSLRNSRMPQSPGAFTSYKGTRPDQYDWDDKETDPTSMTETSFDSRPVRRQDPTENHLRPCTLYCTLYCTLARCRHHENFPLRFVSEHPLEFWC